VHKVIKRFPFKFSQKFPIQGLILLLIWGFGAICDRIWLSLDNSIPGWDQSDYLTGTLNYWRALQNIQLSSNEWWQSFWLLSSKIPPLTYIITGLTQNIFGAGQDQAMLVMLLFSGVLIYSVYGIGKVLFNATVGLWAAALCQLLPGLYRLRLQFLLDYPLAAVVTLCFFCLTAWHNVHKSRLNNKITISSLALRWYLVIVFGISLGLALLIKQSALFFLLTPIIWVGVGTLRSGRWGKLLELAGGIWVSSLIFGGWYRTNWLMILTSSKRATIDSAIAEGDPPLNTVKAWIFYWQLLPYQVSLPLLLIPVFGLLLYWARFAEKQERTKTKREKTSYSLRWLGIFLVAAYLLTSLNINKDDRYIVPYLPILAVFLAYGLTVAQSILGQRIRWGTLSIAAALMLYNLFPISSFASDWIAQTLSPNGKYRPDLQPPLPHKEVIAEIIRTEPYLRSTLGVLPSTSEINQHNLNYYGALAKFQVYGRQVGIKKKDIEHDARSMPWFITKTGEQGSVPSSQKDIVKAVETSPDFELHSRWKLKDGSWLRLYEQKVPEVEVRSRPMEYSSVGRTIIYSQNVAPVPVTLTQVTVPKNAPPGFPVPVTYKWSGSWDELKNGLVLLTWHKQNDPSKNQNTNFSHDHALGMGNLYTTVKATGTFQVIEHTAMLPPADIAPGTYILQATYLNRISGETYPIYISDVTININPQSTATQAPELDLVTQLRSLSANLPKGTKAVEKIFAEVARINQYDPTQDYLSHARLSAEYRLQHIGQNSDLAYSVALADVLQRRVKPAISSLQRVTQLDAQNPFAWGYLAFVRLYNWQPRDAEAALKPALEMNPNQREFKALAGVAALMRGNVIKAWQELKEL
jgi:4-amino-4-deoxy-L-arabinose transferase-like glycosyltransferase